MTSFTAEQAQQYVHHLLLPLLANESRITQSVLAAVPAETLDYRPDSHAKTARELLRHIAASDNTFLQCVLDGIFQPGAVKIPDGLDSPAQIADWYASQHAARLQAIREMPADSLICILDFSGLFQRPAFFFLQIGLGHTIHHRGQLSTYLRPMGARVPAIYGESYDSAAAKNAASASA